MPELPEVETLRQKLIKPLRNTELTHIHIHNHSLRVPIPKSLPKIATKPKNNKKPKLQTIQRRGKYLLFQLSNQYILICHLGMSGQLLLTSTNPQNQKPYSQSHKHEHIVLIFTKNTAKTPNSRPESHPEYRLGYRDTRRFGSWDIIHQQDLAQYPSLKSLGPEPLNPNLTGKILHHALANRKLQIKDALLNQKIIAGIGNIYASEALFRAQISPQLQAQNLTPRQCQKLANAIVSVLNDAIRAGGSTRQDYRHPDNSSGYFQHQWAVYDRQGMPCPKCNCKIKITGGIQKSVQNGRSTFFCPTKQK